MSRKCCVVGCDANNRTHRLFNFPKNDKLRELWLSQLIPVNIGLNGLSKAQLLNKYVCQKHFDRHQFDGTGNRLAHGYPCLFTEKEILHGIPLSSLAEHDVSDHNYALRPTLSSSTEVQHSDNSTVSTQSIIINAEDHKSYHNNCAADMEYGMELCDMEYGMELCDMERSTEASTNLKIDGKCTTISGSQEPEIMEIVPNQPISTLEAASTDLICGGEQTQNKKPPKRHLAKRRAKLTTQCRCFIKRKKEWAIKEKKQSPFSERFVASENLSHRQLFIKNFSKMTQQAQDFLLMQLKMAGRKKEAMRYTTNEKMMSLSLMKESPEGYWILRKIFNLPTKRTLNRLAEKLNKKINVGIN